MGDREKLRTIRRWGKKEEESVFWLSKPKEKRGGGKKTNFRGLRPSGRGKRGGDPLFSGDKKQLLDERGEWRGGDLSSIVIGCENCRGGKKVKNRAILPYEGGKSLRLLERSRKKKAAP